ncbi:hypothetical protein [Halarcobacter bivalviorum]|uniref:Uncharacterized protein n=1 Tax=Halarcobacter bivalviorum TaxID=663364 RepID=A0AAX2ADB3_9BACT|nr:hypothetical protein [Halarcobacter bivalviorum]AXH12188.1 hypothetical protein ABIV_1186 [Halarcobacter bivalviorum]RXK11293.1 hypothetical protein CRV05_02695 [Halarcobacter bivalviorum]
MEINNSFNTDKLKISAAYYESSIILSTSSVSYEKPISVKWKNQLVFLHMQYAHDLDNIKAEINLKK